jgi:hypothetical protein
MIKSFTIPDKKNLDKWLNGGFKKNGKKVAEALEAGDPIADSDLPAIGVSPTEV